MGFGSTHYGAGGFGSGGAVIVPPGTPGPLFSIQVVTKTQVLLTFVNTYVQDSPLFEESNYIITSDGPASTNIKVVSVEAGNDRAATNSVLLTVQTMVSGVLYTITTQNMLDTEGIAVDPLSSIEWPLRVTKVQNALSKLPKHFDLQPGSTLRGIMTAIARVDDEIGGNG